MSPDRSHDTQTSALVFYIGQFYVMHGDTQTQMTVRFATGGDPVAHLKAYVTNWYDADHDLDASDDDVTFFFSGELAIQHHFRIHEISAETYAALDGIITQAG